MPEYQRGKMYKIVCNVTDEIYVGSTTKMYLSERLVAHVSAAKSQAQSRQCTSKQIIDRGDYKIELIENYPCDTKKELHLREGFHVMNNVCVNKVTPGRTKKECDKIYRDKHKDEAKIYMKQYRETQGEDLLKKKREYHHANKEAISIKDAAYYQNNKEVLKAKIKARYDTNKVEIQKQRKLKIEENKEAHLARRRELHKLRQAKKTE